jgi:glycosyltransferase involved in cell wall biosynthesis
MKILTISYSDLNGGASIAAYRLHREFMRLGLESRMLVGHKVGSDKEVSEILPKSKLLRFLDNCIYKFFHQISLPNTFYLSTYFIKRNNLVKKWADVIILRNIHGDYLSENLLPYLSKYALIFWRLPDMWAMTGHCVYSLECDRWKTGCGACPDTSAYYPLKFDTSNYLWNRKKDIYSKSNFKLITPSYWMKGLTQESPLMVNKDAVYIPTGVDTAIFTPLDKAQIRSEFSISPSSAVVMFGSHQIDDVRKGGNLIPEILNFIREKIEGEITVLTVGAGVMSLNINNINHIHLGKIMDDGMMNKIYNLANVYALPVAADNLPNTLVEASAAGIPSVVFDVGGCSEIILNEKSGYVVDKKNTRKFAACLVKLLMNDELRSDYSKEARSIVMKRYSMEKQAEAYIGLMHKVGIW